MSRKINILIIEDNIQQAQYIKSIFSTNEFHIKHISNGKEAYYYLERNYLLIDIVLIDYYLPDMNGIEIIEKLQNLNIVFIFLTSVKNIEIAEKAIDAGAISYITKSKNIDKRLPLLIKRYYKLTNKTAEKSAHFETTPIDKENILIKIFKSFNNVNTQSQILETILDIVSNQLNIPNIAIRIKNKENDFPYKHYKGFKKEHISNHNSLYVNNKLVCLCGAVIDDFNNNQCPIPLTEYGSFYTNDLQLFVQHLDKSKIYVFKNTCINHDFKTLALIPIKQKNQITGLIQIAYKEKNKLNVSQVSFLEEISMVISIALEKHELISKLSYNKELEEQLLSNISDLLWLNDEKEILYLSPSYFKLVENDIPINKKIALIHLLKLAHPKDKVFIKEIFKTPIHKQTFKRTEFRLILENGKTKWLQVHIFPILQNGIPYRIAGIASDITQLKQFENTIIESEERLSQLLNAAFEGIAIIDENVVLKDANRQFAKMLGVKYFKIENINFLQYLDDESKEKLREAIDNKLTEQFELLLNIDNKITYVLSHVKPILYKGFNAYAFTLQDITELKQTEQELIRTKIQAEQANRAKSDFLANMSHEIRTPLNGITGMVNLMQKSNPNDQQKRFLNIIESSSKSLLQIINDILDISKVEAGKMTLSPSDFSLSHVLSSIEKLLLSKAKERNNELIINIDKNIPEFLFGDDLRIKQILINLVGNAIKFTENGEVSITVSNTYITQDLIELKVAVSDTGIGISKEKQKNIFNSFVQADGGTTKRYGGTGLGLTITKTLIQLMDGSIWVESEENKGTTFIFTIHVLKSKNKEFIHYKTQKNKEIQRSSLNIHVLIAEDNIVNQLYIKGLCKYWGISFDMVENGLQALELYKKNTYDCVLMDIFMPELNGAEVTKKIRELEKNKNTKIPIIALTAAAFKSDIDKFMSAGFNEYITKPISEDKLIVAIKKHCSLAMDKSSKSNKKVDDTRENTSQLPIFDEEDYMKKTDFLDKDTVLELFNHLKNNYKNELQKIEEGIKENDNEKTRFYAHAMKNTLGNYSSPLLFELMLQAEKKAKNGDLNSIGDILDKSDKFIVLLIEKLSMYISKL